MNKRIIAALIAASGLVAFNASANDGTVNFIGDITDGACTVDVQNTGSSTGQVTLGSVPKSAFSGVGSLPVTVLVWLQSLSPCQVALPLKPTLM
jgi:major type 1 subunit fimbrin (pilin)